MQEGEKLRVPPVYEQSSGDKIVPGSKSVELIKKNILYKDTNVIILNKPSGMVVHGGTGQAFGVIESVRKLFRDEDNCIQLVHRLDKETSGILMLARNMQYLKFLHKQFKDRQVYKLYKALLCGHIPDRVMRIELPLARNTVSSGERMVAVDAGGKQAQTIIKLEKYVGNDSLVEVELTTGRTHQIRVHASEQGYPVAGDGKYGDKKYNKYLNKYGLKRLFLHAYKMRVPGNDNYRPVEVTAPIPEDLSAVLQSLQTGAK
ncbi:MAG: RluA family pseudouridine synthase [Gammaproteobacteria bacterium]|nr:RluA family pseudouridine synthase [Gammaproteobacteria bacterium]